LQANDATAVTDYDAEGRLVRRRNGGNKSNARGGGRLTLSLNVTFKAGFAGYKGVWVAAETFSNVTSAWRVAGAWQVPP